MTSNVCWASKPIDHACPTSVDQPQQSPPTPHFINRFNDQEKYCVTLAALTLPPQVMQPTCFKQAVSDQDKPNAPASVSLSRKHVNPLKAQIVWYSTDALRACGGGGLRCFKEF